MKALLPAVAVIIAAFLSLSARAQGVMRIPGNAYLKVTGNAVIKFNNTSLEVQGGFAPGAGTVEFQGNSGGGVISGAQPLTFQHIVVNRPGKTVQLEQDIQVDGNLTFTAGMFELNGHDLTLGQPNGLLVNESESSHITGASGGEVIVAAALSSPSQVNPGNIGVALTTAANLGATTIRRGHTTTALPPGGAVIQRYFDISPANNANLNATLRFYYFQSELAGLNEAKLNLFRHDGVAWASGLLLGPGNPSRNAAQNWVQKSGIGHCSAWTLAECLPVSGTVPDSICAGTSYLFNGTPLTTSGTYQGSLTSVNGCDSIITLQLTVLPAMTTNIAPTAPLCATSSTGALNLTVINGVAPLAYQWSAGLPAVEDPNGLTAGTYTVTVTDAKGCSVTASATITAPPPLTAVAAPASVSCFGGNDGAINLTVTNGNLPLGFAWSNGAPPVEDPANLPAGAFTVTVTDAKGCTTTASATVGQPAALATATTQVNVNCFNGNNGSIDLTVTGGTPAYAYSWGAGIAPVQDPAGLAAGAYTVTVTDAKGCTITASATLTQPAAIMLAVAANAVACFGGTNGSIDLTVSGGTPTYAYNWGAGIPSQQDPTNLAAGTYTVTVTDAKGCTTTSSATITQPPAMGLSATAVNVSCFGGNNGSVSLSVSGGSSPYGFLWSTGQTQQNPASLSAGVYTVTVTDAKGCTNTSSATVGEPPAISASSTPANVSCFGGSNGSIDLTVSGGTPQYAYNWGAGVAPVQDPGGLPAGAYTVTITDSKGCTATASATVGQPTALTLSAAATPVTCTGGSNGAADLTAGGGTTPYTFSWSNSAKTEDLTNVSAGVYTVTVTDSKGCTATATAAIGAQNPPINVSIAPVGALDCLTPDVTLAASTGSNATFQWSTGNGNILSGAGTAAAVVDQPGNYQVVVTIGTTGCTGSAMITVTQTAEAISGVSFTATDPLCFGNANGVITVTSVAGGAGPFQYALNGGAYQSGDSFGNLTAGSYTLTVRSADGCTAEQTAALDQPDTLTIALKKPDLIQEGQSASLQATVSGGVDPFTYAWEGPELSCPDCPSPSASPQFAAPYSLTITDANGCTVKATVLVEVDSPVGPDIITPGNDDGKNDNLTFPELDDDPSKYANNDIVIFNRWGQVVFKAAPYQNNWNGVDQDGNALPEGTYYYVLLLRDGQKDVIYGSVLIIR